MSKRCDTLEQLLDAVDAERERQLEAKGGYNLPEAIRRVFDEYAVHDRVCVRLAQMAAAGLFVDWVTRDLEADDVRAYLAAKPAGNLSWARSPETDAVYEARRAARLA